MSEYEPDRVDNCNISMDDIKVIAGVHDINHSRRNSGEIGGESIEICLAVEIGATDQRRENAELHWLVFDNWKQVRRIGCGVSGLSSSDVIEKCIHSVDVVEPVLN